MNSLRSSGAAIPLPGSARHHSSRHLCGLGGLPSRRTPTFTIYNGPRNRTHKQHPQHSRSIPNAPFWPPAFSLPYFPAVAKDTLSLGCLPQPSADLHVHQDWGWSACPEPQLYLIVLQTWPDSLCVGGPSSPGGRMAAEMRVCREALTTTLLVSALSTGSKLLIWALKKPLSLLTQEGFKQQRCYS